MFLLNFKFSVKNRKQDGNFTVRIKFLFFVKINTNKIKNRNLKILELKVGIVFETCKTNKT